MPGLASFGRIGGALTAVAAKVSSSTTSFTNNLNAGDTIATLNDPFSGKGLGTTTFVTFGSVPGQLSVNGSNVVAGSSAIADGTTYAIGVLAVAGDGSQAIGTKLSFLSIAPTTLQPPSGYLFIVDPDGSYVTDPDGAYLVEAA